MKVKVNEKEVIDLNETRKKVIKNEIPAEIFDADMERRVCWVCEHKYEKCFARLKAEWDKKLGENGVALIPSDPDAYAELVFLQPNYKDRSARDAEATGE